MDDTHEEGSGTATAQETLVPPPLSPNPSKDTVIHYLTSKKNASAHQQQQILVSPPSIDSQPLESAVTTPQPSRPPSSEWISKSP